MTTTTVVVVVALATAAAVTVAIQVEVGVFWVCAEITIFPLKWKRRRHSQLYLWLIIHICALTKQPVYQNQNDDAEKDAFLSWNNVIIMIIRLLCQ